MRIKKIGVKNFRSFADCSKIDIKPINVFVGRNSSGKSSFARLLPLLRQSVEAKTKGSVLWFGRYVDFGSFETTKTNKSSSQEIGFSFDIELKRNKKYGNYPLRHYGSRRSLLAHDTVVNLDIQLTYDKRNNKTYTSSIEINIFDNLVRMEYDSTGWLTNLSINGDYRLHSKIHAFAFESVLVPSVSLFENKNQGKEKVIEWVDADNYPKKTVIDFVRNWTHGNLSDRKIIACIDSLDLDFDEKMKETANTIYTTSTYLSAFLKSLNSKEDLFQKLKRHILFMNLSIITTEINTCLVDDLSNIRYIKPLRATAQRYYRYQELAIDEIDPEGGNIAMFLESMESRELNTLNIWLQEKIDVVIEPKREGGHLALNVSDNNGESYQNLADMGFGYSQVLPILVQLWMTANQKKEGVFGIKKVQEPTAIVIEQPELHLHPEMQAKLSNIFVEISKSCEGGKEYPIIIETHSSHIINRFGRLVSEGMVDANDIGIYLFDHSDGCTKIKKSSFNDEGYLENWPYGFFEPS